jgi:hypothetical protein
MNYDQPSFRTELPQQLVSSCDDPGPLASLRA